jgi:hypothetical protein
LDCQVHFLLFIYTSSWNFLVLVGPAPLTQR